MKNLQNWRSFQFGFSLLLWNYIITKERLKGGRMTKNKLKVSTKTPNSLEKQGKILSIIKDHPEGIYPKTISLYSKINLNTIKSTLTKLKSKGIVTLKNGIRGLYLLVENDPHGSLFDWKFHNANLSSIIPDYCGETMDETVDFGLVRYDFSIGKDSKQATMRVITDYPINISAIFSCFAYFSLFVNKYTGYTPKLEETTLSSIEFNQDYVNLRFDGVKCITLTSLLNQFKVYEKENCVRVEYKTTIPIQAEAIASLLNNQTPYLSLIGTVREIKQSQEKSNKNINQIHGILSAILDKFNKNNPRYIQCKKNSSNEFKSADQYSH